MNGDSGSGNVYFETRKETVCFQSLDMILEKLRLDGTFQQISSLFQQVIDREMTFTINGEFKRARQTQG